MPVSVLSSSRQASVKMTFQRFCTTLNRFPMAHGLRGFTSTATNINTIGTNINNVGELSSSARTNLREGLAGSGPFHKSCIFLHHPEPPSKYPPKITSALWRALTLRAARHGGLVNFCWRSDEGFFGGNAEQPESYPATIFLGGEHASSTRRAFHIPNVTHENLDMVDSILSLRDGEEAPGVLDYMDQGPAQEQHIYVCTHGSRDCRCGDMGGAVVDALRREVSSRSEQVRSSANPDLSSIWDRIKIGEVAHVGGHK